MCGGVDGEDLADLRRNERTEGGCGGRVHLAFIRREGRLFPEAIEHLDQRAVASLALPAGGQRQLQQVIAFPVSFGGLALAGKVGSLIGENEGLADDGDDDREGRRFGDEVERIVPDHEHHDCDTDHGDGDAGKELGGDRSWRSLDLGARITPAVPSPKKT